MTSISKEAQIAIVASHQLALGYTGVDTSPGSAARQGSTQLQGNRMAASITEGLGVSDVPQEHSLHFRRIKVGSLALVLILHAWPHYPTAQLTYQARLDG